MKKVLLILLPILLLGGGFVGLAVAGVIKVPGLSPTKVKPQPMYGEAKDKPVKESSPKPVVKKAEPRKDTPKKAGPGLDPEQGAKKLAQLWNTVPTTNLLAIAKQFQDEDLAPILVSMDPEKVAELLAGLDPKRSANLSKEVQQLASIKKS